MIRIHEPITERVEFEFNILCFLLLSPFIFQNSGSFVRNSARYGNIVCGFECKISCYVMRFPNMILLVTKIQNRFKSTIETLYYNCLTFSQHRKNPAFSFRIIDRDIA